jgi:hypothetical protein
MPIVEIDVSLSENEEALLKEVFECNDEEFKEFLQRLIQASSEEITKMVLGQKVFTRGRDMQVFRLSVLIRYFFDNEIPDEQQVSALFQLSITESRSLIKACMSKYQYELQHALVNTIYQTLGSCDKTTTPFKLAVKADYIREAIDRLIGQSNHSLPRLKKSRYTVAEYELLESSYNALRAVFSERHGLTLP